MAKSNLRIAISPEEANSQYDAAIAEGKKRHHGNYTPCQDNVAVWINNGWDRNDKEMHCFACRADGSYWRPLVFLNGSTTFVGNGKGDDFTFLAPDFKGGGRHPVTIAGRARSYTAQSRCATITVINQKLSGKSILRLSL